MRREFLVAVRLTLATLLLTGLVYPLTITGIAQVLFPSASHGSLVTDEGGTVVGSRLIGQPFAKAAYLQPRPSAAGATGYDGASSGGSNLGQTSQKLRDRVAADIGRLKQENPAAAESIPADLITASASGLDPHVSPAGALWQVPRIAAARGVAPERIQAVIQASVEHPTWGVLGEPRVNVLEVNLALDRKFGRPK